MDASVTSSPAPSAAEVPLLPACLTRPAALLWLWALPVGVLLLLNLQAYDLIGSNFAEPAHLVARLFGVANLLSLILPVAFWIFATRRTDRPPSADTSTWIWAAAIGLHLCYLASALYFQDTLVPLSTATWIYSRDRFLFNQFSFAMLPLAQGSLFLATRFTASGLGRVLMAGIMTGWATAILTFLATVITRNEHAIETVASVVGIILVLTCALSVFLVLLRALMSAFRSNRQWAGEHEGLLIVMIALIAPLCGLALNRLEPFPADFQTPEVYGFTVGNAAILFLASVCRDRSPLLSFALLCASFPFSLYFFIVFLPYLPLAIPGVFLFGLGLLILSPTLLFVLHLQMLHLARSSPALTRSPREVLALGLLCAAILPGTFVVRGLADRAALHAALDYVYEPKIADGDIRYLGSTANLRRALDSHRAYKNGVNYPLLSDFYGWLVFDRLILPDKKLARLEATFFGVLNAPDSDLNLIRRQRGSVRAATRMPSGSGISQAVRETALAVRTAPAGAQNTTVTLSLTLANEDPAAVSAEYTKRLPLPVGVFAQGFRLSVNGRLEPGRLVEKKTALWVYSMIRNTERRDPGILAYSSPGELELRVFPVNRGQPTTVEIDFLFPGPLAPGAETPGSTNPAAVLALLARGLPPQLARTDRGSLAAVDATRASLPAVEREPYLHVIIDRSLSLGYEGDLPRDLAALRGHFPEAKRARVSLAHYEVVDLVRPLVALDELVHRAQPDLSRLLPAGGGLDLDRAVAHALRLHRELELDHVATGRAPPPRPIIVVLSRDAQRRSCTFEHTTAWADLAPGLEVYERDTEGGWVTHREDDHHGPFLRLGDSLRPLAPDRPTAFTPSAGATALEYWSPAEAAWRPVQQVHMQADTPWARATRLHLTERDYARSPGDAGPSLKSLVYASRESGLLLPETSYIVVENSVQWKMLEASERQKLGQNAALEFRETPSPPALWLIAGFAAWLGWRRWRGQTLHGRRSARA